MKVGVYNTVLVSSSGAHTANVLLRRNVNGVSTVETNRWKLINEDKKQSKYNAKEKKEKNMNLEEYEEDPQYAAGQF